LAIGPHNPTFKTSEGPRIYFRGSTAPSMGKPLTWSTPVSRLSMLWRDRTSESLSRILDASGTCPLVMGAVQAIAIAMKRNLFFTVSFSLVLAQKNF
jgi:hypothetical protein